MFCSTSRLLAVTASSTLRRVTNQTSHSIISSTNITTTTTTTAASTLMTRRHFASKPTPPPPRKPVKGSAPSGNTQSAPTRAKTSSKPTTKPSSSAAPPTASALAAKKVVDEIMQENRMRDDIEDDDDPDEIVDDEGADPNKAPLSKEELAKRARAGFDQTTLLQLRRWLPRNGADVPPNVAAQCARLLNRTKPEHLDVINLAAMFLFRVIAEAKWHVFLNPTKQGVLLAFSTPEAIAAFSPSLPRDDFEIMTGAEIGAAIIDDEEGAVKSIAFDAASIQNLKPSITDDRLMVLIHWADSVYFERFIAELNPDEPLRPPEGAPKPAESGEGGYDPSVLWHRAYIIGAVNAENATKAEDLQLMSDSEDRIVLLSSPDHVAEAVIDGRITPISLSAEELISVLETQQTGLSITVGSDENSDHQPTRHKAVTWTQAQALRILNEARPRPGDVGFGEDEEDDDDEDDGEPDEPEPPKAKAAAAAAPPRQQQPKPSSSGTARKPPRQ